MKRKDFIKVAAVSAVAPTSLMAAAKISGKELTHSVIFDLIYEKEDQRTDNFLCDAERILTKIAVVRDFQVLRQVSPKCDYAFGFTMNFKNKEDFDIYCNHPDHVAFVKERWESEVERFQEIDYISY